MGTSINLGVLTAGGDSPGLNAALRALGKTALRSYDSQVIGFHDGFRGLMQNRSLRMDLNGLAGILTVGGTILGTSRDKPHKMQVGNRIMDATDLIVENYDRNHLDALVCIGGGGTQKNALRLADAGLNVLQVPKTIDNDISGTDTSIGFDTAFTIASEAIDRLHSTAHSHHRIIVVEVMGHNAGWLALGAGLAAGADVILIPEIPYDVDVVAATIVERRKLGRTFSIVAVSEGARSAADLDALAAAEARVDAAQSEKDRTAATAARRRLVGRLRDRTHRLAAQLEKLTRLESRVTILGHVQRGGVPTAADRLLATRLGSACADLAHEGAGRVMVANRGQDTLAVPLDDVAGVRKSVPPDHPWLRTATEIGVGFGIDA